MPRAQALCSTAIRYPHAVAYEDLARAPQSGPDAPAIRAVLAQGGRFYAAAPVRMPDGHVVGVLCLAGPQPRPFSPAEQQVLEALADVASQAMAVRHLCLATPELGPDEWRRQQQNFCPALLALHLRLDELLALHGTHVPVLPAVLLPIGQRLSALHFGLSD